MSDTPPTYSNYPRQQFQMPNYDRPPGVYLEAIGDAWTLVRRDLSTWVLTTLAVLLVSVAIYGVTLFLEVMWLQGGNPFYEPESASEKVALNLKSSLIGFPAGVFLQCLYVGMIHMAIRQKNGLPIAVGDVFKPLSRFGPMMVLVFLTQLCVGIGALLCLIPGIFLAGALSLAPTILFEQRIGPIQAMDRSLKALGNRSWMMFGLLLVLGLMVALGGCTCGVGVLFTGPIAAATVALHYLYFFSAPTPDPAPTGAVV